MFIMGKDGDTPIVERVIQTLNIRVTDEEGNKSVQVVEEDSTITVGKSVEGGDVKAALDTFYEENIKDNYVEATELEQTENPEEEPTVGESGEQTVGSSEQKETEQE